MLKRRFILTIITLAVLSAALSGCSNGNGELSPVANGHGEENGSFGEPSLHGPLAKSVLTSCQPCHGTPTTGVNPRFNVPHINIPQGCETCHQTFTAHPTPWLLNRVGTPFNVANATTHATATSFDTVCTLCHGAALDGVGGTAPSCMSGVVSGISCHVGNPSQTPTGCTSCHSGPPTGPSGVTSPNRAFAHGTHLQFNLTCDVCHNGGGYGTATHANGVADVVAAPAYQAKATAFAYNNVGSTCAGISCHGGKTTPAWPASGAITVATDCKKCHDLGTALGTPENNSYYSGKHQSHLTGSANNLYVLTHGGTNIFCTDCHSTAKLTPAVHFGGLTTPGFDVPPRTTIGGAGTKLAVPDYVTTTTCATASCHISGTRDWFE
jgi:predicted CxxxxCH...CXXCH cytochrome family protein